MEMEVERSFYMLERKGKERSITLFNEMSEAIKKISGFLKAGTPSNQIELSEIDVGETELTVKVVPWSTIAEKIVKTS